MSQDRSYPNGSDPFPERSPDNPDPEAWPNDAQSPRDPSRVPDVSEFGPDANAFLDALEVEPGDWYEREHQTSPVHSETPRQQHNEFVYDESSHHQLYDYETGYRSEEHAFQPHEVNEQPDTDDYPGYAPTEAGFLAGDAYQQTPTHNEVPSQRVEGDRYHPKPPVTDHPKSPIRYDAGLGYPTKSSSRSGFDEENPDEEFFSDRGRSSQQFDQREFLEETQHRGQEVDYYTDDHDYFEASHQRTNAKYDFYESDGFEDEYLEMEPYPQARPPERPSQPIQRRKNSSRGGDPPKKWLGKRSRSKGFAAEDRPQGEKVRDQVMELGFLIVPTVLLVLLVRAFIVSPLLVPTDSMEPSIEIGDRVLVNKLSYRVGDVGRGDLVVARGLPSEGGQPRDIIKRVIGLPGETVEIKENTIIINDELALNESQYLAEDVVTDNHGPVRVPDGELFLLGDNRAVSGDSRDELGTVPVEFVEGRAFVRYWPGTRFGFL